MHETHFGTKETIRRFWVYLRPQRRRLIWAIVAAFLATGFSVLAPIPVKIIIDQILQGKLPDWPLPPMGQEALAITLAVAAALLSTLAAIFSAVEKNISAKARETMTTDLRMACLDRLFLLTPLCRNNERSGELGLRLIDDTQQVARLFTKTGPVILRHVLTLIMTLGALAWINPILGVGALGIAILLSAFVRFAARPLAQAARAKRKQEGLVAGTAQEIIRLITFVQASSAQAEIRDQFQNTNRASLGAGVKETRAAVRLERLMQIANGLAVALIVGGGALLAQRGAVSAGDLAIAVIYLNLMLKPVEKINELASAVTGATTRAARLSELLDRDERLDRSGTHRLERARGALTFDSPRFAYESGRTFAFDRIEIPARQLVLISGPSGSGKSTLLALLTRLFDPAAGRILLDGQAFPTWDLDNLRSQFAIAPQAPPLMAGTVRKWLGLGNGAVSEARMWDALKSVSLAKVLLARGGLDTLLGEGGVGFSGGEQARLSLARALIADRPLLLLDEPFANVDATSMDAMLAAIRGEKGRRTIIIVSHQPLPDGFADLVFSMRDGQLLSAQSASWKESA